MRISCMKYLYMLKTSGTKQKGKRRLQGREHGIYYMMIKADFSCVTENLYLTNIGIYSSISHMCLNSFTFQKSIPILKPRQNHVLISKIIVDGLVSIYIDIKFDFEKLNSFLMHLQNYFMIQTSVYDIKEEQVC